MATLKASGDDVSGLLVGTPDEWLDRGVTGQDPTRQVTGWRILLNMAEHDIHHRSQIATYAGLAGWEVKQLFGTRAEEFGLSPARQANPPEGGG